MVPENYVKRVIQFARQGYTDIEFPTYDTDWDSARPTSRSRARTPTTRSVKDAFLSAVEGRRLGT
jgi:ribonucleoside-diphosphate reductase alpha chain